MVTVVAESALFTLRITLVVMPVPVADPKKAAKSGGRVVQSTPRSMSFVLPNWNPDASTIFPESVSTPFDNEIFGTAAEVSNCRRKNTPSSGP